MHKKEHAYPWFWNSKIMLFLKCIIAGLYFPLPIQIVVLWKTNFFASVTWAFLSISGHWISTEIDLSLPALFATDWGHFCCHHWKGKSLLVCSRWKSGSCWISHDALRYPPPICNQFSSVQLLSHVRLFMTSWTAAHQASLSITNSQSLLKLMSIK